MLVLAALGATASLAGAAYAFGGAPGVIWDDGKPVQPGSLDDGKALLPRTDISLDAAVSKAQQTASGALGQVDLVERGGTVVYVVDVGDHEVSVSATNGAIVSIDPQD